MIKKFVEIYESKKSLLEDIFKAGHPQCYADIVEDVITILSGGENDWETPDPDRIHEIDDGDYQGTLVYVIGANGYQPSTYWAVMVSYGSCSGCDTLQSIHNYDSGLPTDEQVKDYMTLALHIVQGLEEIG